MKKTNIQKLTVAALLCAVAVVGSLFSFPVFGSKCAPVQHMVNILCAVLLGPWYGVAVAFVASLLRNLLGLGTLMAFPSLSTRCRALPLHPPRSVRGTFHFLSQKKIEAAPLPCLPNLLRTAGMARYSLKKTGTPARCPRKKHTV